MTKAVEVSILIAMLIATTLLFGCKSDGNLNQTGSGSGVAAQWDVGPNSGTGVTPAGNQITPISTASNNAYRIGPMDVLDISVFKVPDLSKSVQVADTGTINLPLVGEIPAAGKTAQELERDLTAKLGAKYLQNPQVTVYVKEGNSQRVTLSGAVKSPGVFPIKGTTSLLSSIAMAGGLDPNSDSTVLVLRTAGGKRQAAKFDISAIQKGQADDPSIQSGDVIVAGSSAIKSGFNAILKALPVAGLFAFL